MRWSPELGSDALRGQEGPDLNKPWWSAPSARSLRLFNGRPFFFPSRRSRVSGGSVDDLMDSVSPVNVPLNLQSFTASATSRSTFSDPSEHTGSRRSCSESTRSSVRVEHDRCFSGAMAAASFLQLSHRCTGLRRSTCQQSGRKFPGLYSFPIRLWVQ